MPFSCTVARFRARIPDKAVRPAVRCCAASVTHSFIIEVFMELFVDALLDALVDGVKCCRFSTWPTC